MDVNTPLGGAEAVFERPVATMPVLLTSVAATSTGDFTVVFLGTSKGHLKKVRACHLAAVFIPLESASERRSSCPYLGADVSFRSSWAESSTFGQVPPVGLFVPKSPRWDFF